MTRINTNVPSLVAQNRLSRNNNDLQEALTRLSTGLKINSGKDDPAGLIASEALRSEITGLNKAISNTNRANQIITTADSALGQVSSLLNDIRGLVVEAANSGALSDDEVAANQLQVDSSLEAINRIAQTTTFQGRKLLNGDLDFTTTAGANFGNISSLQIDQANLGSTGSLDVQVDISQAATKAAVDVGGFREVASAVTGSASTGSIDFAKVTTAADQSTTGAITLANTDTFTLTAKADGDHAAEALNTYTVNVATVATGTDSSIAIDDDAQTVTVNLEEGETLTDIATLLDGSNSEISLTSSGTTAIASTDAGATGTFANGDAAVLDEASIAVTAAESGAAFNGTISLVEADGTTTPTAAWDGSTLTVTVEDTDAVNLDDITTAINDLDEFDAVKTGALTDYDADDANYSNSITSLSGGVDETTIQSEVVYELDGAIDFSHITSAAVQSTSTVTASGSGEFSLTAKSDGAYADDALNGYTVNVATADSGTASSIAVDDDAQTITVTLEEGKNLTTIASDLSANADFTFASTETTNVVDAETGTATMASGAAAVTDDASIAVTGNVNVPNFDGTISFVEADGTTTPTAAWDGSTLTVTVEDTDAVDLDAVTTAIDDLDGFNAVKTGTLTRFDGDDTDYSASITNLTGGDEALSAGVQADTVFELSGARGSEVFNVSAGTTLDQLVSQINLVKDGTGIEATADGSQLQLRSTEYGSDAVIDLRVIEEGEGGNFTGVSRATGSDVEARVNGREATGKGNQISINTATLDLTMSVAAEQTDSSSFTISGGGALFQLGGEVVSNQQARIGIGSVSSARLGGAAGRLFQLGSGESAALANNTTMASEIVTEAINQVTSLRGRLGAFQSTTLESNSISLNDAVANLTEAESSIRDADFAQESARLTRAQILVQSGTNVLSQANQNPQNVLSLLR